MDVTKTCRDINELSPNAQQACELFMRECKKQGLNVLITETYRSQKRQNYLYEQGRTRPGNVVTWTKTSNHTGRMAWDICKNIKGEEYSDRQFFVKCGDIAKKFNIEWGGTWNTPDTPHFQVSKTWTTPIIDELQDAVDILHSKGVINTPTSWNTLEAIEKSKRYLPELIANFMKVKFDVKVCCYNDSIVGLYQQGIISDLSVWAGLEKPSANNIRFLLIKMAKEMM